MTHPKTHAPRRAAVPAAALAALLLAGCSATHVGDAWQCPLPKGGSCGSVAEADPAVPDTRAGPAGNTCMARAALAAAPGADVRSAAGRGPVLRGRMRRRVRSLRLARAAVRRREAGRKPNRPGDGRANAGAGRRLARPGRPAEPGSEERAAAAVGSFRPNPSPVR